MARPVPIGDYESQVPVQEGLRRIIPEMRPGGQGQGLEDVGNAVQQIVRSEAANYSLKTLSDAQSHWTEEFINRQQSAQPGAPNFTPSLMKDFDDYTKAAVKGAPNQLAGRALNLQLTQFGHTLSQKAMLFEANARQSHNEDVAKDSIDSASNELVNDPTLFDQRLAERQTAIDAMNLDPQVKEKLNKYAQQTLSKYAVTGDINRDPYGAYQKLIGKDQDGYYANLPPEQREQLMNHADQMIHQRVADAERVHQLAKQEQQDNSDLLLKQGITMSQGGKLTADWVIGHSASLEPNAMKYLLDEAAGKKTESDPRVYADLLDKAGRGVDVRGDAKDAFFSGSLSKEDYTRITDKTASELPNSYKQGIQYIQTALKPGQMNPDPAHDLALANALSDFQDWFRQNPNSDADAVQSRVQNTVRRYQLLDATQSQLTLKSPEYLIGTRAQPDIQGTKKATVKAFQDGTISRDKFNEQARLLQQWQHAQELLQQKIAKSKADQNQ